MQIPLWTTILISILTAISGSFGVWVINYIKTRRDLIREAKKLQSDIDIEQNKQAVIIYKDIIEELKKDILELKEERRIERQEYIEAREKLIKYKFKEEEEKEK